MAQIVLGPSRAYPNIPTVGDSLESHTNALKQIVEALNIHERRIGGSVLDSFVRVSELETLGLANIDGTIVTDASTEESTTHHHDSTYLRLDGTNDPVTGSVSFSGGLSATGLTAGGTIDFSGAATLDVTGVAITGLSSDDLADVGIFDTSSELISTGLLTGGVLSVNGGDNTKFDIAAGTGVIVDHSTSPPTVTQVSFGPFTAQTVTNLATQFNTDIAINAAGAIVQQTSFTNSELRSLIFLGGLDHNNKTTIDDAFPITVPAKAVGSGLKELSLALGDINTSGNIYSANGVNLNINKSAGTTFSFGRNFQSDADDPHTLSTGAATALTFGYVFNDGSGNGSFTADTTTINPNNYDNGTGTLATVAANRWTIQRILFFPNVNKTFVQYGVDTYVRYEEALDAVPRAQFLALAGIRTAMVRGYLVVQQGETDLTNATFLSADRLGRVATTSGGIEASFDGLTDTTFTSLTTNNLAQWNGSTWVNVANLDLTGNITLTGTVDGRDVAADGTAQDSHIADSTIHFTEASINHANILNIGTNTHAQIDTHIATADTHVAHSGVNLTAGAGLTGGGTIALSRTFNVGAGTGITVNADDVALSAATIASLALADSALQNIVEDLTPQLGGNLDVNTFDINMGDSNLITFGASNDITMSYNGGLNDFEINSAVGGAEIHLLNNMHLVWHGGAATVDMQHDGTDFAISNSLGPISVLGGTDLHLRGGGTFRAYDGTSAAYVDMYHNATDAIFDTSAGSFIFNDSIEIGNGSSIAGQLWVRDGATGLGGLLLSTSAASGYALISTALLSNQDLWLAAENGGENIVLKAAEVHIAGSIPSTEHIALSDDDVDFNIVGVGKTDINVSGFTNLQLGSINVVTTGTVDGRDVSADGATLDAHVADATIHFTQAAISIPLSQINDVTATAAEVNLLDLAGLTAGWALIADSATTASWQAITESDISDLGAYLLNIVEDTTPQLGGNLDTNNFNINLTDSDTINFGTGNDITMKWDGVDFEIEGALAGSNINIRDAMHLFFWDADNSHYAEFQHDGSDFALSLSPAVDFSVLNGSNVALRAGGRLRAYDGDSSDYVEVYHSGTNAQIGTTLGSVNISDPVNITGALTATSYGGITEANLVDKTATETISGTWTYSQPVTVSNASGGPLLKLKDSGGAGAAALAYVQFLDSADAQQGYVGADSISDSDITLYSNNGRVVLDTGGSQIYLNQQTQVRDAKQLLVMDSLNTSYITMSSSATTFTMAGTSLTDFTISGVTQVNLGNFTFNVDQTVGAGQDNYVLTYDNASGEIGLEAAAGGGLANIVEDTTPQLGGELDTNNFDIRVGDGDQLIFGAGGDFTISHDGASNDLDINSLAGGGEIYLNGGMHLFFMASVGGDYADFQHDGADFNMNFFQTANLDITGLSGYMRLQATIMMQEQAAAEADLAGYGQYWVKTVTPNQPWFTNDAGTDLPLGYNVMQVLEQDAAYTFDRVDAGKLIHKDAGAALSFTCNNDSTIPQGSTWVVFNDDTEDLTIAQGTGVTVYWLAGGGAKTAGNVTVEQGGVVTVYKYSNTVYYVWGSKEAGGGGGSTTLAALTDTNITTPADAALLLYDTGTATWRDATMSGDATITDTGVINVTFADNAGTLDSIDSSQFLRSDVADQKTAGDLRFNDAVALTFGTGADLHMEWTGTYFDITTPALSAQFMRLRDGLSLRMYDTTDVEYMQISNSLTSFQLLPSAGGHDLWLSANFATLTASSTDADFDAITGTSFGGILSANLVDKAATETITGAWDFDGTLTYDLLNGPGTSSRDKIRVYSSGSYAIGMQSGITFGGIVTEWAMTFQMNDQATRGFWWGDQGHTTAQGAMALTTDGKLTVANAIRVGYGETDTTVPGGSYDLEVSGTGNFTGALTASSFGGITSANLVDKSAAETVSGLWYFTYASEPAPAAGQSALTSNFLHIDGKEAIDGNDTWLRLNQNSEFSSGVYIPTIFQAVGTKATFNKIFLNEAASATTDVLGDGQIWVKDNAPNDLYYTCDTGIDYPVAYATYRRSAANTLDNGNQTLNMATASVADAMVNGCWYSDNATAYTLTLEPSTTTNFPVGAQLTVWNEGTGTLTINEGTSTTLYYMDGSGSVTDTAGGMTLAQGGYLTIIRKSTTVYLAMGAGGTA